MRITFVINIRERKSEMDIPQKRKFFVAVIKHKWLCSNYITWRNLSKSDYKYSTLHTVIIEILALYLLNAGLCCVIKMKNIAPYILFNLGRM